MSYVYIMSLVDMGDVPEEARPFLKDSKHGPHCTLLFLGQLDANKPSAKDTAKLALESLAENMIGWQDHFNTPLLGKFGGVGRFSGSESSEGLDVFYLSVDSPGLFGYRNELVKSVQEYPYSLPAPDNSHGFVPHMTLKFLPPEEATPLHRINTTKVDLNRIRIVVGKEFMDFHAILGGTSHWSTFEDGRIVPS